MINIFEPRTMLNAVEQLTPANTFLRDTFFSNVKTSETEHIDIDIIKGKRRMAPFVHPKMPGKVVARDGYRTQTYTPPLINPKRVTTAEHVLNRRPGEAIYGSSKTAEERAQEIAGEDLSYLDDLITRREEWMAAQALFTGKIEVNGEGISEVIDFGHTLKETLIGDAKWNSSNADPLTNMRKWRSECITASGVSADIGIMATDVADFFLNNSKLLKMLDNRRVTLGQIEPKELPNGVTYLGYIGGRINMDLYTYEEMYLDDDGVEKPMVPNGKLLTASTNSNFIRAYGAYVDVTEEAMTVNAVPRYPRTYIEKDPPVRYLQICSRPLLIPQIIDSFHIATVL